ncbi:hypothetical protein B9Z55_021977 [Caenorhabditis nigoni]|uniref:DUF38 domain-containing protein n=1 Tax=Caenorhabditis nigoni TaxID=1611254 RepID=A0A2G5TUE9_9PELO|nr:hypothetical protein B9Z55_021977 [Caenorhabditis nigoni]
MASDDSSEGGSARNSKTELQTLENGQNGLKSTEKYVFVYLIDCISPYMTIREEDSDAPIHYKCYKVAVNAMEPSKFTVYRSQTKFTRENIDITETYYQIMHLFKSPDSTIEEMKFGEAFQFKMEGYPEEERMDQLFAKIFSSVTFQNLQVSCKVSMLEWNLNIKSESFLKFLNYLDPMYLQKLHLTGPVIMDGLMDKLMETEHWKCLSEIKINGAILANLENFYHFNVVDVQIKELNPWVLSEFIKNYHTKNLYQPNNFTIRSKRLLEPSYAEQVWISFDPFDPLESFKNVESWGVRLKLFEIPRDSVNTRVVFILNGKISGYVWDKETVLSSFMIFDQTPEGYFSDVSAD